MQTVKGQIEERLRDTLNPEVLDVVDFSAEHAGHAGSPDGRETHFRVRIACAAFDGKNRVTQHRMVQNILVDLMPNPIHALEIKVISLSQKTS